MHEYSLMADLFAKINQIADEQQAKKIVKVTVKLGALAHISAAHFREHFIEGIKDSKLAGAELAVEVDTDTQAKDAQEIVLKSIEVV